MNHGCSKRRLSPATPASESEPGSSVFGPWCEISALDQKQTSRLVRVMSVIPLKADIRQRIEHVLLSARSGHASWNGSRRVGLSLIKRAQLTLGRRGI